MPLRDARGEIHGLLGLTRDITEKRETEEALRTWLKELADLKFALDESAIVAFTDQKGQDHLRKRQILRDLQIL